MVRIHIAHRAAGEMFQANEALMDGRAGEALGLYTQILYTSCPGHPCAFLNRSLAYIALGYPELAAADAYRAADVCQQARKMYGIVRPSYPSNANHPRGRSKTPGRSGDRLDKRCEEDDGASEPVSSREELMSELKFMSEGKRTARGIKAQGMKRPYSQDRVAYHPLPARKVADLPLETITKGVEEYLKAERRCLNEGHGWTTKPWCYSGRDWLNAGLASVVLWEDVAWAGQRPSLDMLEVKALFRLCGALWECGNGAISDALGLIADVSSLDRRCTRRILTGYEESCFDEMGDRMLDEILRLRRDNPQRIDGLMKMKATMVNRVVYPWNHYHPDLDLNEVREELAKYCDRAPRHCTMGFTKETPETPFTLHLGAANDLPPEALIFEEPATMAARTNDQREIDSCDTCGVVILRPESLRGSTGDSKRSDTSPDGYDAFEDQEDARTEPFSPASLEAISRTADGMGNGEPQLPSARTIVVDRPPHTAGPELPDAASPENEEDELYGPEQYLPTIHLDSPESSSMRLSGNSSDITEHPSKHGISPFRSNSGSSISSDRDLSHCAACHEAQFCSPLCSDLGISVHIPMCRRNISEPLDLRLGLAERCYTDDAVRSLRPDEYVHPKAAYLHQQLLARTIALGKSTGQHPLVVDEVKWLNGELYAAPGILQRAPPEERLHTPPLTSSRTTSTTNETAANLPGPQSKRLPWSFDANIVQPLQTLSRMKVKTWERLEEYDGWVLNTLLAKIMHSVRISKGFRFVKRYDSADLWIDGESDPASVAEPLHAKDVWVATLHPLLSVANVADLESGETSLGVRIGPNFEVRERDTVRCYALPAVSPSPTPSPSPPPLPPHSPASSGEDFPAGILRNAATTPLSSPGDPAPSSGKDRPQRRPRIAAGEPFVRATQATSSDPPRPRPRRKPSLLLSQPGSASGISSWLGHVGLHAQQRRAEADADGDEAMIDVVAAGRTQVLGKRPREDAEDAGCV